jgi:protein involved in temperature-dependent protein secretion
MKRWWLTTLVTVGLGAAVLAVPSSDLDRALETQEQIAAENPTDPDVFNDLGNLLVMAYRLDEAELAYRAAIQLDPQNTNSLFNLAILLADQGEAKEAVATLGQVIETEPRHAWAHYHLGRLLEAAGSSEKAISEYAVAFSIEPELTFPEVNPQLLDSKLMTQALIAAFGSHAPVETPRLYSNPDQVRDLLLPTWAHAEEDKGSPETPDADVKPQDRGLSGSAEGDPDSESDDIEDDQQTQESGKDNEGTTRVGKILGPESLESRGSLGQASPLPEGTGGSYADRVMRQVRRSAQQRTAPSSRRTPTNPENQDGDLDGGSRTSTFSTGRIELRIRPLTEPVQTLAQLDPIL